MSHKLVFIETSDVVETTLALDNFRRACDCGRGACFFRCVVCCPPWLAVSPPCKTTPFLVPPSPHLPLSVPTAPPDATAALRGARWPRASTLTGTTGAAW